MALGADRGGVVLMVLRGALRPIALGLLIGVPVAVAVGAMASQLFGVTAADPAVLAVAVFVLAGCAVFAAWLPARRSASIEPMTALRIKRRRGRSGRGAEMAPPWSATRGQEGRGDRPRIAPVRETCLLFTLLATAWAWRYRLRRDAERRLARQPG